MLRKEPFLGHVLSEDGIYVDLSKVQEVLDWKAPTSVTEVPEFSLFSRLLSLLYLGFFQDS